MSEVTFAKRTTRVTSAADAAADARRPAAPRGRRCARLRRPRWPPGCIPIAAQRLPQDVGAAIAEKPMRRLETDDMLVYYPEGREIEAWRFLTRVEGCVALPAARRASPQRHLRREDRRDPARAGVQQRVRRRPASPATKRWRSCRPTTRSTRSRWSSGCRPIRPSIGCHEITHYVHFQQIAGFAWFWNLFGQVYTPQIGLDPVVRRGAGRLLRDQAAARHRAAGVAVLARRLRRRLRGQALQRRRSQRLPARLPRRQLLPGRQPVRALPGRPLRRGQAVEADCTSRRDRSSSRCG